MRTNVTISPTAARNDLALLRGLWRTGTLYGARAGDTVGSPLQEAVHHARCMALLVLQQRARPSETI